MAPEQVPHQFQILRVPAESVPLPFPILGVPAERVPLPFQILRVPAERVPLPFPILGVPAERVPIPFQPIIHLIPGFLPTYPLLYCSFTTPSYFHAKHFTGMNFQKIGLGVLSMLLLGAVFFGYKNHFNNPFEFDDDHTIVSNYYIRDISNIPLFFKDATTTSSLPANQAYRPGLTTLNAIDYWWGGKPEPTPFYYHVHIFIAFLILGYFIYRFSLKIFDLSYKSEANPFVAFLVTAVFLLHTANAETINYIISRSDTQSTLFILISLFVFTHYPQWRKYQVYLVFMVIGFFIKEPAVMVGPFAFLYLYFFEQNHSLKEVTKPATWTKTLVSILPALFIAAFLFWFAKHMTPTTWNSGGGNVRHYLQTEFFVMVHYVKNYFLPFELAADTDWGLLTNWYDDRVIIGIAFIAATVYLAYRASLSLKWRPVAYGILWFYISLLPTSSFFPFSEVLNDHRVFLPYIGLTISCVWALFMLYEKYEATVFKSLQAKGALGVLVLLFLSAHVYGLRTRCEVWSSGEKLWYDVTVKCPKNGRGLMNYGNVLMSKGDYKGAEEYFMKAKQEWPYYSYIFVNLGVLYNAQGKPEESEKNFKEALRLNPNNPNCYIFYANLLKTNGRASEARAQVEKGLMLSPKHPTLNALKTELLTNPAYVKDAKSKIELLQNLSTANPTPENYINLSLEYYTQGMYRECILAAEEAAKLRPTYDIAYNNICSAYNMLHEWDKAIEAGQKAVELNPNNQLAKNNLKAAFDGKASGK